MKNIRFKIAYFTVAVLVLGACAPRETDDDALTATDVKLPEDWQITAVDNDNTLAISFAPCTFIDGEQILGVQLFVPDANIQYLVKDPAMVTYNEQKIYKSGDYTLYAAPVTYRGIGVAREVPFTIVKNLLLETLTPSALPDQVQAKANNAVDETVFTANLYIENNSEITLADDMASDDVIVNLDFFERTSSTTVRFLAPSGVYAVYWNPVRKNVLIEPLGAPATLTEPDYYVFTGMGIGAPTTVSSDDIKAANGGEGEGRYTTWWDPGSSILSRVLLRNIAPDTYQGTVAINAGATFKPFSNANWGNDTFAAANCTFTGSPIFEGAAGDWAPNESLDLEAYYRITVNAETKAINVKKVDAAGKEIAEEGGGGEPQDPDTPIDSDNFDPTTSKVVEIGGETFMKILHTMEKDAEYTLKGLFANSNIVYNLDFFERTAVDKVKFLGESGDYTLYYSLTAQIFTLSVESPDFPGYMVAVGKGFAYPSKTTPFYAPGYPQNCTSADILQYVLYRCVAENTYQATVMLKGGADNLEFKGYHAAGGGNITNNWGQGGEYRYEDCTFAGVSGVFTGAADGNNWIAGASLDEALLYRVTITITDVDTKTASVNVQVVDWDGVVQP